MSARDWRVRIDDILEAAEKIGRYTAGLTYDEFAADEKVIDAVLRNVEIIGEAARHVPDEVTIRYPAVPWRRMRAMRNIVIHSYRRVDLKIVWDTLRSGVPELAPLLRQLLNDQP